LASSRRIEGCAEGIMKVAEKISEMNDNFEN